MGVHGGRGFLLLVVLLASLACASILKRREDKTKCPQVKAIYNFDLLELLGRWYVVQYYASSEEALAYRCMRAEFSVSSARLEVSMNFTYAFTDDPVAETLNGNITWEIPDASRPSHWMHAEDTYEGVYNTYVLDSDYKSWALLLHCAEKSKEPRYLSSFIMSRDLQLGPNVVSYLRDKLPRYDIDLSFMFPMSQINCIGHDEVKDGEGMGGEGKGGEDKGGEGKGVPLSTPPSAPITVTRGRSFGTRHARRRLHPLRRRH